MFSLLKIVFIAFVFPPSAIARDLSGLVERIDQVAVPAHLCAEAKTAPQTTYEGFPFDLARHRCLFDGAWAVAGASVSNGNGTSPINVLADASQAVESPRMFVRNGSGSREHIERLLSDPTDFKTVFAYDLFFWDGIRGGAECGESVANLKKLLEWSGQRGINLVLGNIPSGGAGPISIGAGGCASILNAEMEACRSIPHCFLVDNRAKAQELRDVGYIEVGDRRFTAKEIRPDGLHFSRNGAILAADFIAGALDAKEKNCPQD